MPSALIQKREQLSAKQKALAEIFAASKQDDGTYDFTKASGHGLDGDQKARVDRVQAMNAELIELNGEVKSLADMADMADQTTAMGDSLNTAANRLPHGSEGGSKGDGHGFTKSLGELFIESNAYKGWHKGAATGPVADLELPLFKGGVRAGVALKTLFETSAGWAPETIRTGKMVENAQRPVQMLDFIPATTTGQTAVVYMEETTFTNAAAETAEGGSYGEATLELTEQSSPVRKIAVYLPVTDEQMEDVAQVQGYVNNRLSFMLNQRLDYQVTNGDGISPNLTGVLNTGGIQTQALGGDPVPDAIYKAIIKVKNPGRANADLVALESTDWQDIRLLRTVDGIYIWGSPSEPGPMTIWGLPVVLNDSLTPGTGLVGDYGMHSELAFRRNVTLQVGYVNDDFIKGKQAIRADLRAAFTVYRPAAFCTVTGI